MLSRPLKAQQQVLCGGLKTRHSAEENRKWEELMLTHAHTRLQQTRNTQGIQGHTQHGQALLLCLLLQLLSAARGTACAPGARAARARVSSLRTGGFFRACRCSSCRCQDRGGGALGQEMTWGQKGAWQRCPSDPISNASPLGRCCRPHPGLFTFRLLLPTSPTQGAKSKGCFYTRD